MLVVCSTRALFEMIVPLSVDVKLSALSSSSSHINLERDVKQSTHWSKSVSNVIFGAVVCPYRRFRVGWRLGDRLTSCPQEPQIAYKSSYEGPMRRLVRIRIRRGVKSYIEPSIKGWRCKRSLQLWKLFNDSGSRAHNLCDMGVVFHQLNYQTNWEPVILLAIFLSYLKQDFYLVYLLGLTNNRIDLNSLLGVYVVLGAGLVLAFLTLIAEILLKRKRKQR